MATLVLRAASRRMMPPATSLVTMRALFFSTRVSDNFLSGASSLYAESMAELYENDPSSVPEVSSVDVYFHHHHHHLYLLGRYDNSYSFYFSLTTLLFFRRGL